MKSLSMRGPRAAASALLVLSLLAFAMAPWPAASAPAVSLKKDRADANHFTLHVSPAELESVAIEAGEKTWSQLVISGFGAAGEAGEPSLPFRSVTIEVPPGMGLRGEVGSVVWTDLPGSFLAYPKQPPAKDQPGAKTPPFTVSAAAYERSGFTRSVPFEISGPAHIRGHRFFTVDVYPVRYDPGAGLVSRAEKLKIELYLTGEPDPAGEARKSRLYSDSFERQAESLLLNYLPATAPAPAPDVRGPLAGLPGDPSDAADYLIIAADQFESVVAPLADWNTRKGYKTRVATMSEVGATSADVMEYVQTAYDTWSPAPNYLLIVGDHDEVPTTTEMDPESNVFITDFPYSCLDGPDYFPDINMGRVTAGSTTGMASVLEKIVKYDRDPDLGSWYGDALVCAYFEDENQNCITDRWFTETATYAKDFLEGPVAGYSVETSFVSDFNTTGLPCSPAYWSLSGYPHRPDMGDTVDPAVADLHLKNTAGTAKITSSLNSGVGLVFHRDHGAYSSWHRPHFTTSGVFSLTNGDMTPVVLSINCETGKFNEFNMSLAEAFLANSNGGAVGVAAASDVSYSGYNDLLSHGFFTAFWPEYDAGHTETAYPNSFNAVEAMNFAKYYLRTYEGLDIYALYTFRLYHWFGDPLTVMRTETPHALTVSHGSTLAYGSTAFKVFASDEGARVGVAQAGDVLGYGIVAGGSVEVQLTPVPRAETVGITVTAHNAIPYEGEVSVVLPSDADIYWDRSLYGPDYTARLALADIDIASGDTLAGSTVGVLAWTDTEPAPITLVLEEVPKGSGFFQGDLVLGTDLAVSDGDTLYARYIDADDGQGGTDVPAEARADVDGGPPAFAGLSSALGYDGRVELSWPQATDSHGPITYYLYKADDAGGEDFMTPLYSTTALSYTDTAAANCEDYFYVVRAEDSFGNRDGNTVERGAVPTLAGDRTSDTFGSDSSVAYGIPGRGNLFEMEKTVDLAEIEVYVRMHNTTTAAFFVYESDAMSGDYSLIHYNVGPAQGSYPNKSWITSGPIDVTLKNNRFYYIGFTLSAAEQYYQTGSAPSSASFGTMLTGVNDFLVSDPPGDTVTINAEPGDASPFMMQLDTKLSRSSDGYIEMDRTFYRHDADVEVTVNDYDLICQDSLTVEVWSASSPSPTDVGLAESPVSSGNYIGQFTLSSDLMVVDQDTVTARYVDASDGLGGSSVDKSCFAEVDRAPPVFAGIESAVAGDSVVFLEWGPALDPHGPITYHVYRASNFGGQDYGSPLYSTTATSYADGSAFNDSPYYYAVRAEDGLGYEDGNTAQRGAMPRAREMIAAFPLDSDPGWSATSQWEFGVPAGGGSCAGDPTSGHTGPNVYGYNLLGNYGYSINPTRWLVSEAVDLTGYSSTQLRFWRWLGAENSYFDKTFVQASNNGADWEQLWTHGGTMCDSEWTQMALDISAAGDGQAAVQVRWGMGPTNNGGNYPGWNIDDIEFWGVPVSNDSDLDGLGDDTEALVGSNPYNPDTDGEGLSDYDEYIVYGTDPSDPDTDGDLADDYFETIVDNTDALDPDDYIGAVPHLLNYNGRLRDAAGAPVDGNVELLFSIHGGLDSSTVLWSDTADITVSGGIFSALVGPVPASLFQGDTLYLAAAIDGGTELSPRMRLMPAPFAMDSEMAGGGRIEIGEALASLDEAGGAGEIEVVFPRGFTAPPRVALGPLSMSPGGSTAAATRVVSVTSGGFTVMVEAADGGALAGEVGFTWLAHGR